jgi:hypothetical protein
MPENTQPIINSKSIPFNLIFFVITDKKTAIGKNKFPKLMLRLNATSPYGNVPF